MVGWHHQLNGHEFEQTPGDNEGQGSLPSLSEFSRVCCGPHKGFGIVNKEEVDVFLELSCFFNDPMDVAIWSLVPLPFLNSA